MKKLHLALIFSSFLIVSGCSDKTSEEYILLAEKNIQENDIQSAVLALKNAISINGQDPRSRFILGNLYAQRGSSAAAEKELVRALELGYEPNEVLPILAKSYSLQFKHEEIIKLVEGSRGLAPDVSTSLLLYKALAHFHLGKPYKAKQAVSDANEISSESLYSKLGNAYVDFSNKQVSTSLGKINEILKEQPDFADAHLLKGQLASASNDATGSVESFEKYRDLLPETLQSHIFLANAYIKNEQLDKAEEELDLLLKARPNHPFVNQLKGLVRYKADDFANAKLFMDKAIQNGLSNPANNMIAGVSAFKLKNYEQAYESINAVKEHIESDSSIQKLFILLQLKLGLNSEASDVLNEMDNLTENDVALLSLTMAQLLREGKVDKAKELMSTINLLDYTSPENIAQKGMLALVLDDVNGITDLEDALALDPNLNRGNTELARAYLKLKMFDKALALSQVWIKQKPSETNGYILAARAHLGLEDIKSAEIQYQKALNIDVSDPNANIYYADNSVANSDYKNAAKYLLNVLNVHKENLTALRKYFLVAKESGHSAQGIQYIESAFINNPSNQSVNLLYARALNTDEQYEKLLDVFGTEKLTEKTPSQLWELISNVQFKLGKLSDANTTLNKWLSFQPSNKRALLQSISLDDTLGKDEEALALITKAKQAFADDEQFRVLATYFHLKHGNKLKARNVYTELSPELKSSAAGSGLEGQVLLLEGQAKLAVPKLKTYYEAGPSVQKATLYAKALKQDHQLAEAISFLNMHIQTQGTAVLPQLQIAELYISNKDFARAEASYQEVLSIEPENIKALNNLSYLLVLASKYNEALPYAEKAVELSPDSSAVLDTLSQVLLNLGDETGAKHYSEKARLLKSQ